MYNDELSSYNEPYSLSLYLVTNIDLKWQVIEKKR